MTLLELVSTLNTENVNVLVKDATGTIIEYKSQGYAGLNDTLTARTVEKWTIANALSIVVTLVSEENI